MRSLWLGSVLSLVGMVTGCSNPGIDEGSGASGPEKDAGTVEMDAGSAEIDAAPPDEHYAWGNVTVDVMATGRPAVSLTLNVTGQPAPLIFPSVNPPATITGALLQAKYTCTTPGLYEIDLWSCTDQGHGTAIPSGCLQAVFTPTGIRGSYVDPTGAGCDLVAGTAAIQVPHSNWGLNQPVPAFHDAAVGSFTLECQDSAGGTTQLDGDFALTLQASVLDC